MSTWLRILWPALLLIGAGPLMGQDRTVVIRVEPPFPGIRVIVDDSKAPFPIYDSFGTRLSEIPASGVFEIDLKDGESHSIYLERIDDRGATVRTNRRQLTASGRPTLVFQRSSWNDPSGQAAEKQGGAPPVAPNVSEANPGSDPLPLLLVAVLAVAGVAVWLVRKRAATPVPIIPVAPAAPVVETPQPAAEPEPEGWPGQMALRYPHLKPVQKVKAGGAGTIFLVKNLRARNRLGAVKVLHAQHAKGENPDSQRFLAEPKVLSLLKDLAIAPQLYSVTYDQPGEDAVLWYEMEWLEDYVTLRKHLGGKGKRLPRAELMTVVPLLVRGVARMHGRGVVHRDLTPENIMVASGLRDLRLVDFGLVRFTAGLQGDDRDTFGRIDEVNEVIGKPSYCPPEQWLDGLNAAREPADWYAVGAIIWELVTGYTPYRRPEEVRESPRPHAELVEQLRREAALEEHLLEYVCGLLDPQPETRAKHAATLGRIFGS
jgi:hypothetical protein